MFPKVPNGLISKYIVLQTKRPKNEGISFTKTYTVDNHRSLTNIENPPFYPGFFVLRVVVNETAVLPVVRINFRVSIFPLNVIIKCVFNTKGPDGLHWNVPAEHMSSRWGADDGPAFADPVGQVQRRRRGSSVAHADALRLLGGQHIRAFIVNISIFYLRTNRLSI